MSDVKLHQVLSIEIGHELSEYPHLLRRHLMLSQEGLGESSIAESLASYGDFRQAARDLLIAVRLEGHVDFPSHWIDQLAGAHIESLVVSTPSSRAFPMLPTWRVTFHDEGCGEYCGQANASFNALNALTRALAIDANTRATAAFDLWVAVDWCDIKRDYGGAVDGISLVRWFPPDTPHIDRIIKDALCSQSVGVQVAGARALDWHPLQEVAGSGGIADLARQTKHDYAFRAFVRALRVVGGEQGFEALLKVSCDAPLQFSRNAVRALAWTRHLEDVDQRLRKLVFSRVRRISEAAGQAISERTHHSVSSEGGWLATDDEKRGRS
jgi:hypothetical protein